MIMVKKDFLSDKDHNMYAELFRKVSRGIQVIITRLSNSKDELEKYELRKALDKAERRKLTYMLLAGSCLR